MIAEQSWAGALERPKRPCRSLGRAFYVKMHPRTVHSFDASIEVSLPLRHNWTPAQAKHRGGLAKCRCIHRCDEHARATTSLCWSFTTRQPRQFDVDTPAEGSGSCAAAIVCGTEWGWETEKWAQRVPSFTGHAMYQLVNCTETTSQSTTPSRLNQSSKLIWRYRPAFWNRNQRFSRLCGVHTP